MLLNASALIKLQQELYSRELVGMVGIGNGVFYAFRHWMMAFLPSEKVVANR